MGVPHFECHAPLFPPLVGVVCCGATVPLLRESGPARAYHCPICETRYTMLVKPERRVRV